MLRHRQRQGGQRMHELPPMLARQLSALNRRIDFAIPDESDSDTLRQSLAENRVQRASRLLRSPLYQPLFHLLKRIGWKKIAAHFRLPAGFFGNDPMPARVHHHRPADSKMRPEQTTGATID